MRNDRRLASILVLALVAICTTLPARAQGDDALGDASHDSEQIEGKAAVATNLLANSNFVSDLLGWTKDVATNSTLAWVPNDVGGDPRSGAVRIVNGQTTTSAFSVRQCISVTAGKHYVAGGNAWVAAGAPSGAFAFAEIFFYASTNCSGSAVGSSLIKAFGEAWTPVATTATAPAGALSALVYFGAGKAASPTPVTAYFDKVYFHEGACAGNSQSLCLDGERFQVLTLWSTADGNHGSGGAVPFTADSGSFWFFDPSNVEVNVKVIDACSFNGKYWVFASGGTNVKVLLLITDTKTGVIKSYTSPLGQLFPTIADVNAFPCS